MGGVVDGRAGPRPVARATERRRALVRGWIEDGVAGGELAEIPADALASILLALADGLILHRVLDPGGFRWVNISRAVEVLLGGLASDGTSG